MNQILVREEGGEWSEPRDTGFALENELQEILSEHPELIPGVGPAAMACREFQSAVGPADIVVVDEGGEVTVVECKLATNPQIRREIIGQLLDYASRLWGMDIDDFNRIWSARSAQPLLGSDDVGATLREAVAANLAAGRFRLVLAVDEINAPLKRMVEYLNAMSGPGTSVIAVEYRRFRHGPVEVLMPQQYGQELAESKAIAESQKSWWSEESYRAWLVEHQPLAVQPFNSFLVCAASHGWSFNGSLAIAPAGSLAITNAHGDQFGKVSLFYFPRQGAMLEINLARMASLDEDRRPTQSQRDAFLKAFATIPEVAEVASNLQASSFGSRGPNLPLVAFNHESLELALAYVARLTESEPASTSSAPEP